MNERFDFRIWLEDEKEMMKSPLHRVVWGYLNEKHPVMQYTGLKDKNGKEIYEGDIIKSFGYVPMMHNDDMLFTVKWGVAEFFPFSVNNYESSISPELCEIIGNIYENPEYVHN